MLCEVITTKKIGERVYATVKAGNLVGEVPVAKGVEINPGDVGKLVPNLGVWQGRLQANLVLQK